jgi:hypothetical protein
MSEFKGPFGAKINKLEFDKYVDRYQRKNPKKTQSVLFHREAFERILSNPEVFSISVFFGEGDDGIDTVLLVGRNKNNELLEFTTENRGGPCPPYY